MPDEMPFATIKDHFANTRRDHIDILFGDTLGSRIRGKLRIKRIRSPTDPDRTLALEVELLDLSPDVTVRVDPQYLHDEVWDEVGRAFTEADNANQEAPRAR